AARRAVPHGPGVQAPSRAADPPRRSVLPTPGRGPPSTGGGPRCHVWPTPGVPARPRCSCPSRNVPPRPRPEPGSGVAGWPGSRRRPVPANPVGPFVRALLYLLTCWFRFRRFSGPKIFESGTRRARGTAMHVRTDRPGWQEPDADVNLATARHHSRVRVVALEGRSGSGKSTVALQARQVLATRDTSVHLLSMEDLYPGWEGLTASADLLHDWVLAPLARGERPAWRRYDW